MRPLVLALLACLVLAAPASATLPGRNGLIAVSLVQDEYTDCGDGVHFGCGFAFGNVFTVPFRGGKRRAITKCGATNECTPGSVAWSADGRRMAYDLDDGYIHVARFDGKATRRVVLGDSPTWSPDGRELAYASSSGGIDRINLRSGRIRPVTGGVDTGLDWSARNVIAFERPLHQGDIKSYVYSVRPDGQRLTRITRSAASEPSWSPGARKLAYVRNGHLFVVGSSGGNSRRVPIGSSYAGNSVWSPDGRLLAVTTEGGVKLVRPDGAPVRTLRLRGPHSVPLDVAWQPRPR